MRLALVVFFLPAVALAVPVRVVEVSGVRAYLEPGGDAGLARDAVVRVGGRTFKVLAVTAGHAVIAIGDAPLRAGDRGDADVKPAAAAAAPRAAPLPLGRFAGQWPEPRWPSAGQRPAPVALGGAAAGPVRLTVAAQGLVIAPRTGTTTGHVALDARLVAEPWRGTPLGLDADAGARLWLADSQAPVGGAQPAAVVRELRLRYGAARDPMAALGRLRWAARAVGLLDGVRLRAPPVRGVTLAAFGGLVPDVISGAPGTDVARFGGEAAFDSRALHAAVTAWGSTFDGSIDERRLAAAVEVTPGPVSFDSQVELGMYDAGNPWGLRRVELLAAGAGAALRARGVEVDVRLDARQPERTRYLDSLLPGAYLCGDPCARELRLALTARASWSSRRVTLDAGASSTIADDEGTSESAVFGDAMLRLGRARLGAGLSLMRGELLDERALRAEAGVTVGSLEVGARWRGATLDYTAATRTLFEQRAAMDVAFAALHNVDLVLTVEGTSGEIDALIALITAIWRPLP